MIIEVLASELGYLNCEASNQALALVQSER
jgi:hypothetical protein